MVPHREAAIDRVRALGAPPGDAERVDAIFDAVEAALHKAEKDPKAFREAQLQFKYPFKEAQMLAKAYGIAACGES